MMNNQKIAEIQYRLLQIVTSKKERRSKTFLFRFLKAHGIYGQFMYELKNQKTLHRINSLLNNVNQHTISDAFMWSRTKDGDGFWLYYYKLFHDTLEGEFDHIGFNFSIIGIKQKLRTYYNASTWSI